jgi:hypothetical protein
MWQDLFFASNGIIFGLMLIPQIIDAYHGKGVNLITATLTTALLFFQCYVYSTMGMYFAAIPFTAVAWALVAYFSYTRRSPLFAFDKSREEDRRYEERVQFWRDQITTNSSRPPKDDDTPKLKQIAYVHDPAGVKPALIDFGTAEVTEEYDVENNSDPQGEAIPAFHPLPVSRILDYINK